MIRFTNVYYKYPGEQNYTLKNINLTIKEGEIVAILGDNGAGKTTLAKHMNGLLKPLRGKVEVDGLLTENTPTSILAKKVALLFQYPEKMFFSETVWDEVAFSLKNFNIKNDFNKRVEKALKTLWLWVYKDRSPFTLSGGEQRRLAIASILVWDPNYIILDEPTAGQDAIQREVLLSIIYKLINRNKTVIIITHDVEFVLELRPRVIVMKKGEILYDGSYKDVFEDTRLLGEAGLLQPFTYQLKYELYKKGINNLVFYSNEDAIEKLIKLVGKYND